MRCPYCGHLEDRVVDSREAQDGQATRRRRECLGCTRRFTTYERIEEVLPQVVKKEIRTTVIGEALMRRLRSLDEVAYVRFASVYRAFRDVGEFMTELEGLAKPPPHPASPPAGAGGGEQRKKGDRGEER